MTRLREDKRIFIGCQILGLLLMLGMVGVQKKINNHPDKIKFFWNLLFLLTGRPIFVFGFAIFIMPVILSNKASKPLSKFLSHDFWTSFTRLIYGVFLCNTILMQFYIFDAERGLWMQEFDTLMLYFSFLTFSFIVSFIFYLLIEGPTSLLLKQMAFSLSSTQIEKKNEDDGLKVDFAVN